jgi:hypothetical protein
VRLGAYAPFVIELLVLVGGVSHFLSVRALYVSTFLRETRIVTT